MQVRNLRNSENTILSWTWDEGHIYSTILLCLLQCLNLTSLISLRFSLCKFKSIVFPLLEV